MQTKSVMLLVTDGSFNFNILVQDYVNLYRYFIMV